MKEGKTHPHGIVIGDVLLRRPTDSVVVLHHRQGLFEREKRGGEEGAAQLGLEVTCVLVLLLVVLFWGLMGGWSCV